MSTVPPIPPTSPPGGNGPWRLVVLDRDPDDPKWLLAAVALPQDVRFAALDPAGRYTD
jgi:hypothetical protein